MKTFKKILALFLVLVLSGPLLVKLVHDLSHQHDEVCNEAVEYHFHQQEHRCNICDFTLGNSLPAIFICSDSPEVVFVSCSDKQYVFYGTIFYSGVRSLRAPPLFV